MEATWRADYQALQNLPQERRVEALELVTAYLLPTLQRVYTEGELKGAWDSPWFDLEAVLHHPGKGEGFARFLFSIACHFRFEQLNLRLCSGFGCFGSVQHINDDPHKTCIRCGNQYRLEVPEDFDGNPDEFNS